MSVPSLPTAVPGTTVGSDDSRILELTEELALTAADLSLSHGLAMADSMMLAAARANNAELVTTDAGLQGIDRVTVFAKKK